MAIVKLGPIVSGISGKVGTVVFANAKHALVLRPTPVTRRKSSGFLLASQNFMSRIRRRWATLTDEQQNTWRTAAATLSSTNRIGQTRPMSGFQYFVMTNKTADPELLTIFLFPQNLQDEDFAINPAATFSASGAYTVQMDNPFITTFLRMHAYGWPFWRTTKSKDVPRLVYLASFSSDADPVTFNVRTAWIEHFGALQEGQQYAIGIKSQFTSSPFAPTTVLRQTVTA